MKTNQAKMQCAHFSATLCRMDVCGGSRVVGGFGTIQPSLRSLRRIQWSWMLSGQKKNNLQNRTQYFGAWSRVSIAFQVSNMVTQ